MVQPIDGIGANQIVAAGDRNLESQAPPLGAAGAELDRAVGGGVLQCGRAEVVAIERALSGEPFDVEALTAGLGDVLLVGHDPSFSLLLHDLTGTQARMKKGGLAAVSKGELVALLRPSELSAIAKANVGVT